MIKLWLSFLCGNTAKLVGPPRNFQTSGVYLQDVVHKATGRIIKGKTFFPDSWSPGTIRNKINQAYLIAIGNGKAKSMDFVQAVGKGKNRVWIRIVLKDSNNGVQVMTAHPVIVK